MIPQMAKGTLPAASGEVTHTVSRLQWESFHPDAAITCAPCGFLFVELPSKCPPTELPECNWLMGIPWQSSGEDSAPSLLRGPSQSLVSALRACKPSAQKKQQQQEWDWLRRLDCSETEGPGHAGCTQAHPQTLHLLRLGGAWGQAGVCP